jgi:hypothetical protein
MELTPAVTARKLIRIFVVTNNQAAQSANRGYLECRTGLPSRRRARGRGDFAGLLWYRERGFDTRHDRRRYQQMGIPAQAVEQAPADGRRRRAGLDPRRRPAGIRIQRRTCLSQFRLHVYHGG